MNGYGKNQLTTTQFKSNPPQLPVHCLFNDFSILFCQTPISTPDLIMVEVKSQLTWACSFTFAASILENM